jgi:hypothetical protein
MMGAVVLFITSDKEGKASEFVKRNVVALLLVILSFMIRTEVCIMLMPFLLLAGFIKWGREEKIFTAVNFKKYFALIGLAILGMTAVYSIDKVAYSGSDWTSFRTFFDARTNLYDFYELPEYDENEEFYNSIGLSKESYTLLENYNFALDESIDSWMLKSISDYQKENAGVSNSLSNTFGFVSKNNIKEALWLYKEHLLSSGEPVDSLIIFLYIVCIVFMVAKKGDNKYYVDILGIILLMLIRSVLWLYLYMVERPIDRVTVPLLMLEMCILMTFVLEKIRVNFNKRAIFGIVVAFIIVFAFVTYDSWKAVGSEMDMRAIADARWNALMEYCLENESNYYVIDVYSATSYNGASYSEKIFENVDSSYKNYDICGGWTAKSPLMRQKLSVMGIKYIQSALYTGKAYFIAACDKDITWLNRYYNNRGYNVSPICIDTIYTDNNEAAFMVYKIEER